MLNGENNDTIAAVSTPSGQGGIGIVRISGSRALNILGHIFRPFRDIQVPELTSHTVHYGHIIRMDTGEPVDEVLVIFMKQPNTYTREDIVEINCHGGEVPLKKVLEACLEGGARMAEPGEFTKRAFLNGRLDLSQAEAVLDIISASSGASCKIAMRHLKGEFSKEIRRIREALLDVISDIELGIDFSQEDVAFSGDAAIVERIKKVSLELDTMLRTADKGLILKNGASVVICGRPNVGKSSLMNALLRHDRVIVTPIAGTTRDIIEESIDLEGIRIHISDTAGIIETKDRVEVEGIKRSKEKLKNADVVIFVIDSGRELSDKDREIYETIQGKKTVVVANKSDLRSKLDKKKAAKIFSEKVLEVSALKKTGLDLIEDEIKKCLFDGENILAERTVVNSLRHKALLERALMPLKRTLTFFAEEGVFNGELAASDLNESVSCLGSITGESVEDNVLDRIFSRFCVGK